MLSNDKSETCGLVKKESGHLVVCDGRNVLVAISRECDARWAELAHDSAQLAQSIRALPLIVDALHEIALGNKLDGLNLLVCGDAANRFHPTLR